MESTAPGTENGRREERRAATCHMDDAASGKVDDAHSEQRR
eukprot:CAMPEP_0198121728 /NCGR_PEP_ID=MMETSP1442-20131203/32901_1 /TAXON_ID= /ORGANISM="Craspedostauros australis, Strain CCMP3328" /LENGTH=40 /DNA_ID= /DNA_START= /DNA_END= /DNA_ORIENTATION=